MNVSQKGFIQIVSAMHNEINTGINNPTLEDNESFIASFQSNIFFHAKRDYCENQKSNTRS